MSEGSAAQGGARASARQVELILEQVDQLPTLSPLASRLLTLGGDAQVDLDEVITLIESDPGMSTKILGMCRRADRGVAEKITSVRRAVLLLGLDAVRSAALGVSAYDVLSGADSQSPLAHGAGASFERLGYWKFCLAVACAAELLAQEQAQLKVEPEEAFVAGLLHGLGKIALELVLPRAYVKVLALADRQQCDSDVAERAVLGLDHCTAGKRIAERWQLPASVRDVIWLHAQPPERVPKSAARKQVLLVTLARGVVRHLCIGWSGDFGPLPDLGLICHELGIRRPDLERLTAAVQESLSERLKVLGIDEVTGAQLSIQALLQANGQLCRLNEALRERTARGQQQEQVLRRVLEFQRSVRAERDAEQVLALVARSAGAMLGVRPLGAVIDDGAGVWRVVSWTPEGSVRRNELDRPAGVLLADLQLPARAAATALAALPGLADALGGTADVRTLRLTPLCVRDQMAMVLIGAAEAARSGLGVDGVIEPWMEPLTNAWDLALAGVRQQECSRRWQEELAESTRELAAAQHRLAERESLLRLGEMARGAAHEMNNPLTVISGRSQLLKMRLQDARDRQAAEAIAQAAQDLTTLVTSLNVIAAPPKPAPAPVAAADVLRRAVAAAEERLGIAPAFELDDQAGDEPVSVDADLVARALSEAIVNAAQAAPEKKMQITLRRGADPTGGALVSDTTTPEQGLLFRVRDLGPGLSARAQKHAFDPFYSEKTAGRRAGLGLTRARALLEACGGRMTLDPAPSAGAEATIFAPNQRAIVAESGPTPTGKAAA